MPKIPVAFLYTELGGGGGMRTPGTLGYCGRKRVKYICDESEGRKYRIHETELNMHDNRAETRGRMYWAIFETTLLWNLE